MHACMDVTRKVTSSAVPIGYTRGALQGAFPREGNRESGASVFLKSTFRFLASSSQRAVYRISRGPSPDAPRSSVASRLSGCVLRYLSRHTHSTTAVGRGPARIRRSRSCTSLPSSDWDLLPAYSCFGIRMVVVHEAGRPRPGRKEQKRIGRWGTMWACMWGTSGQTVPGVCVLAAQSLRPLLNYLFSGYVPFPLPVSFVVPRMQRGCGRPATCEQQTLRSGYMHSTVMPTVLATILYRYILHEGAKHPLNPLSHAVQEMPSKVDRVARLVRALVVNPRERR